MKKKINVGQFNNMMGVLLNNVDWESLNPNVIQEEIIKKPQEAGKRFAQWLNNGGRLILPDQARIITLDRSNPFDPEFVGKGWKVWRGPADGKGLEGEEDQDVRSLALTQVDLSQVIFDDCLQDKESYILGEEKHRRLKAKEDYIRLDAGIFFYLWNNQHLIPESWKEKINGNTRYIFFDGTILRYPRGGRCVLGLCFGGGRWVWSCRWLDGGFGAGNPSALLAGIKN